MCPDGVESGTIGSVPVLLLLLVIAVVVGIGVVAAGHGDGLPDAPPDRGGALLPVGPMGPDDVVALHFSVGLRGYRMDEVDDVLDRLTGELAARDRRVAELEGRVAELEGKASERWK